MKVEITEVNNRREKELRSVSMRKNIERIVRALSQKCKRPRCFHMLILSSPQKTNDTNAILTV